MGRDAHILRIALGRGYDGPPLWTHSNIQRQFETHSALSRGVDSNNQVTYNQLFDPKGRPVNPNAQTLAEERCEAINAVTALVTKGVRPEDEYHPIQEAEPVIEALERDRLSCEIEKSSYHQRLYEYTLLFNDASVSWLSNLRRRLLAFHSLAGDDIIGTFRHEFQSFGAWAVLSHGLPSQALSKLLPSRCDWFEPKKAGKAWHLSRNIVLHLSQAMLSLNSELQALHILPASSWSAPVPLINALARLSLYDFMAFVIQGLIPSSILFNWRRTEWRGVAGDIRGNLFHLSQGPSLPTESLIDTPTQDGNALSTPAPCILATDSIDRLVHQRVAPEGTSQLLRMSAKLTSLVASITNKLHLFFLDWFCTDAERRRHERLIGCVTLHQLPEQSVWNWPNLLAKHYAAQFLRDLMFLPVDGFLTRLAVRSLFANSVKLPIPSANNILVDVTPVFPSPTLFRTSLGVSNFVRSTRTIAWTLAFQAGVLVALISLESSARLWYSKRQLKGTP